LAATSGDASGTLTTVCPRDRRTVAASDHFGQFAGTARVATFSTSRLA